MGHATSRTRPSIVALETFARAPAIDVLCGGLDAAKTIPQHASSADTQGSDHWFSFSLGIIFCNFTLDAPRIKSKTREVESIVSHPLKTAEGGASSIGLIKG